MEIQKQFDSLDDVFEQNFAGHCVSA
jgi:hypothetical protein